MLKMIYEGKNYNYSVGKQPYDINTEINVIEDASVADVVQALIAMMKIAGYHIQRESFIQAVNEAFDEKY